ncbi:hypothetical protein M433DRAFT_4668 [Acidomyces richmondensis BFW]|nr:MAG: hypothetical protein FE78DRAFT_146964 [Acidomyces sp. 'richmondensis']KYG45362.1 hypothetical protein M433DRAFT_4668 [Acidomyces richmondensis BFW]
MPEVKTYQISPTALIPNSHYPLIHYPGLLLTEADRNAANIDDLFASNGWTTQWIYRYGPTQVSHYHSAAHECMAVLSGTATIRFGVADTSADLEANTHGSAYEKGGIELEASAGDVFLIPAGVSHKTYDAHPTAPFKLLTPGDGHHILCDDRREALAGVKLSGFTMIGAYPNGQVWDSCSGGEHTVQEDRERVWSVPKPNNDPVLGNSEVGINRLWQSHAA